jgi:hypothetical protein
MGRDPKKGQSPLKSYHFSCGNSTQGPVGICARVIADTKQEAIGKLRAAIENSLGAFGELRLQVDAPAVQYVNVYISPENITFSDLDMED